MSGQPNDPKEIKNQSIHIGRDADGDVVGGDKNVEHTTNIGGDHNQTTVSGGQYNAEKIIVNQRYEQPPIQLTPEEARKAKRYREVRSRLIAAVRYTWISSVLKPAVENDMYIDLGITKHHNSVPKPTHCLIDSKESLPTGTSILDVFEDHGQKILILGEPASGKTITLLTLADQLLQIAEKDDNTAIPIVLNLASWVRERSDLATWIGAEMAHSYQMARDRAKDWAKEGRLILLLDGLDEVAIEYRFACSETINMFQAEYDVPMVVCCRLNDYEKLGNKLRLAIGVYLETLSISQMDSYLAKFGEDVAGIRWAVKHNQTFQELAESPLMLSLMPLAYAGIPPQKLDTAETLHTKRTLLLEAYIEKVFIRRPPSKNTAYSVHQAIHWLSFIAQCLSNHSQTVFRLEEIQTTWLPTKKMRTKHKLILSSLGGLIFGLGFGLMGGGLIGLVFELDLGLISGLVFGSSSGFIVGLVIGLSNKPLSIIDEEIFTPRKSEWHQIGPNIRDSTLSSILISSLINMLIVGLIFTPLLWLGGWPELYKWLTGGVGKALIALLIFFLIGGLSVGLGDGLTSGFFEKKTIPSRRAYPNQGLFKFRKSKLISGLIGGLSIGSIVGFFSGPTLGLTSALITGLALGLILGLIGGLRNFLSHYTIRHLLAREGHLPYPWSSWHKKDRDKDLITFLNSMSRRWLLQRAGSGWVFRHRYLLEYFADQSPTESSTKQK